ncbi:MAG TPA: bifunctional nicotinamidase/pyrazinamidase [Deltaproteobacteria bacterium]|nr:MAG: nicotinamidase [Deltaproteobacteria bacterium GWA2_55_82]OGQ63041.1 MAG: nicotinamidase [Deltaproteobacteria bacterium RIFCSPLOWO2_02_FULL_55_12]OIJ74988.1 MAG: nicotinamidase [Deltaproteobacteria bacterium GWC2_55_46]HBG46187.1 bifunctional nicotinamidase/pyrazinamidase [Deltaproteobacteria bacterium]HCY11685.1 bifunctional nicotinamidase/pyrazinamidase [Deltaproteobacteria bacterium]
MAGKRALLIADLQNDFCPSGALAVSEGDKIVPVVNEYISLFRSAGLPVYLTRDWHPPVTVHFKKYGGVWPPHCVQGTKGAEFHPDLDVTGYNAIITKGDNPDEDSYSAFSGHDDSGRRLLDALRRENVTELYVGGLATDYCVKQSALDGLEEGFKVTVLLDAVKGVDLTPGDSARAIDEVKRKGGKTATIDTIELPEKESAGEESSARRKKKAG